MSINHLVGWNDQKYKDEEQMRVDYPLIQKDFQQGEFPPDIVEKLQTLMASVGKVPLIVRSSSLLEDNFGTAFAGKYTSIFLPNQGNFKDNLQALIKAIGTVYASTLNPGALLYRRSRGLQDYDERMAVLIQVVQGETTGRYYLPHIAGVAFSNNQYRWAPQIRREDGFIRMVWGLGTRAVDRVGNDYPRPVALSHPLLRPSSAARSIRRYSQQFVDVIDLEANAFRTMPVHDVLTSRYPPLRYIAQLDQDGYFQSLRTNLVDGDARHLILTFEDLLRRTPFAERLRQMLRLLEKSYHAPVDLEFTAQIITDTTGKADIRICIIQCRPQSHLLEADEVRIPTNLAPEDIIFSTRFMVPNGHVSNIQYVVFVPPEAYFSIPTPDARHELERTIGKLNSALRKQVFITLGPGRWGTTNPDLGIHIDYADIYNSRALIELTGQGIGVAPEPSLGTHFFQDLLEGQIYPLAISIDDPETVFNRDFFYSQPNCLGQFIAVTGNLESCLRLMKVSSFRPGYSLSLTMDDEKSLAVAYLVKEKEVVDPSLL
jgi:hypothetical protein